jgi:hypothetical protein
MGDRTNAYLGQFVSVILRCQFTPKFPSIATKLLPSIEGNEQLRDIAIAIGALEACRRADIGTSSRHLPPRVVALASYQRALGGLQKKLELIDALECDDVLWTTFLLGLFEVSLSPTKKFNFDGKSGLLNQPRSSCPNQVVIDG